MPRNAWPAVGVAAALAIYFYFGLAFLPVPGIQGDEVIIVNESIPAENQPYYAKVRIFRTNIPTMVMSYLGALKGLIWRGIFAVWPPSVYSLRAPAVLLGGLTLLLFYFLVSRVCGPPTALAAVLLASADPTYIFTARLDWGPVVLARLFCCGGLWLASRWLQKQTHAPPVGWRRSGLWDLAGCGFCFGLGLWDKATFGWFLIALGLALPVFFPRELLRRLRPAAVSVFVAAFLVGSLPMIIYNVKARGKPLTTDRLKLEDFEREKLAAKWANLLWSLDGRWVHAFVGSYLPAEREATPALWLLAGAAMVGAVAAGRRKAIFFPLFMTAAMLAIMFAVWGGGFGAHHYALIYPFPQWGIAAAVVWLWERKRLWPKFVSVAALVALLLTSIRLDNSYLRMFRATGGVGMWSDAINRMGAYLLANPPGLLVNMDWGFVYRIDFLTERKIPQRDLSYLGNDPNNEAAQMEDLRAQFREPNAVYLFHAEAYERQPKARQFFQHVIAKDGLRTNRIITFYQRDGAAVVRLVQVEQAAPAPRSDARQ